MSSFIDTYRNIRETEKESKENIDQYSQALDSYIIEYNSHKTKAESKTRGDLENAIKRLGVAEGKLSKDSSDGDIAKYGVGILNDLNQDSEIDFETYVNEQGNDEQRDAWYNLKEAYSKMPKISKQKPANNWIEAIGQGIASGAEGLGIGIGTLLETPYWNRVFANSKKWEKTVNDMDAGYKEYSKNLAANKYAFLDDPDKYIKSAEETAAKAAASNKSDDNTKSSSNDSTTGEEVTFTIPKANDPNYRGFGQKLVDLGLATNKGLWGADGDVAFYTKQLHDQGIYGNLPIGVPIKLKKRKV